MYLSLHPNISKPICLEFIANDVHLMIRTLCTEYCIWTLSTII